MKRSKDLDLDDDGLDLNDDVDVEAFMQTIERRERKRGKIAWREIERRRERRMLADDLDDYYND